MSCLFGLFLLVICSQLSSSRSLVFCADSGHLPHSPVPHTLHLSCRFPRLSCPFLSLPCNDLLIFPLSPFFYCSFFFFLYFFVLFCCISLAVSYSPAAPCVCDCLPSAGHPVGLASTWFCSCCMNPKGTF